MMRVNTQYQHSFGLNLLSQCQAEEIHHATLEVLDRVGVLVHDEEALNLLNKKGASIKGDRVKIPSWMVQEALITVPCRVVISDRAGKRSLFLEKQRIYYGSGSATTNVIDVYNQKDRLAVKKDVKNAARVADALENIDFVMAMALASDVPKLNSFIHEFEAMMLNTTKPILFCANSKQDVEDIIEMAAAVKGGMEELKANPFLCLYDQPTSPLQHSKEAVEKLLVCAEKRIPIIYIPTVMLGATGPVTMAGALITANCELLSGMVIHQLKSKGAPFIYGGGLPPMDMRTSICSYGAIEVQRGCAMLAAMGRYYNLPVFTVAGCSDAHLFDQQAGMEAGYSILFSGLSGSNLIHDCGYMGAGRSTCLEMLVMCNEVVGMVKRLLRGMDMSEEHLAIDLIEQVGPGGNFIAEEHTFKHFKQEMHMSQLLNRQGYDNWNDLGSKSFGEIANQKVKDILENHRTAELPEATVSRIKDIITSREREL